MAKPDLRVRDRLKHSYDEARCLRENERRQAKREAGRDVLKRVGKPVNPARRKAALKSLQCFAETYFADLFPLEFSQIHLDIIQRFEDTINNGAMYCCACPRGFGKTTLAKVALIWAVFSGRSKFAVLVANNAGRGAALGEDVLRMFGANPLLAEDFPEVVVPFREADCQSRRLASVTYDGLSTYASLKTGRIVMPNIPGSLCPESVIVTVGLTGSVRGLNYITSDGRSIRPDLVLCDDIQDAESAVSPTQTDGRYSILMSDVLGLAGAGGLACMITATVIASDDLTEKMLNNPEFHGHRYALLTSFPKNMKLWKEWNEIRTLEAKANDYDGQGSREFYESHWDEMHEGAEVSWEQRFNPKQDKDALEATMKLYYRDPVSFYSEYQNQPKKDTFENNLQIDKEKLSLACDKADRLVCPAGSDFVTGFIDVHKEILYYTIVAFDRKFNGRLIDYGSFPEQGTKIYKQSSPRVAIQDVWPDDSLEAGLTKALDSLVHKIIDGNYIDESGDPVPFVRLGIDANWGDQTDTVYTFIRNLKDVRVYPTHGQFVGVTKEFNGSWIKPEDRVGLHWRIPKKKKNGLSYVIIDANYWKSFLFNRISTPPGGTGRITVYGEGIDHQLLAQHLSSEKATEVTTKDKRQMVWTLRSGRDNHMLDCFVNSCVMASIEGAMFDDVVVIANKQKSRRAMAYKALRASAQRGDI